MPLLGVTLAAGSTSAGRTAEWQKTALVATKITLVSIRPGKVDYTLYRPSNRRGENLSDLRFQLFLHFYHRLSVEFSQYLECLIVIRFSRRKLSRRLAAYDGKRWNIRRDHASSLDDRTLADRDAWQHNDLEPKPHIVTNDCIFHDIRFVAWDRRPFIIAVVGYGREPKQPSNFSGHARSSCSHADYLRSVLSGWASRSCPTVRLDRVPIPSVATALEIKNSKATWEGVI